MKRLGILLSGRGSNFLALRDHITAGRLRAEIAVVASDNAAAPGLAAARAAGLPACHVDPASRPKREYETELAVVLERHAVDLVVLAGYMRLVGQVMLDRFPNRILNIHPALLPAFPGLHAQRQALAHGVKYAGCTVHFVDHGMDTGPIIAQAVVPVLDDDDEESLSARILAEEHRLYAQAIQLILENKYVTIGRRIVGKK